MSKLLLVEDDNILCQVVKDALEEDSHTVDVCFDGDSAMAYLEASEYELLILDWELPDITGVEICQRFRGRGGHSPVLFLTGRNSIHDKDTGFAVGADDYLTKPFDIRELLMRVKALLRRPAQTMGNVLQVGDVVLETNSAIVKRGELVVKLQPRELSLLEFLMKHPGTYYTADSLLTRIWDTDSEATEIALRSCVAKLRKKIDIDGQPSFIETSKGLGYRVAQRS